LSCSESGIFYQIAQSPIQPTSDSYSAGSGSLSLPRHRYSPTKLIKKQVTRHATCGEQELSVVDSRKKTDICVATGGHYAKEGHEEAADGSM